MALLAVDLRALAPHQTSLLRLRKERILWLAFLLCEQRGSPLQMHGLETLDILAVHNAAVRWKLLILVRFD